MADLVSVQYLAQRLMADHLGHLPTTWQFRFDHARRRAGACHHDRAVITLSRHITELGSLDDAEQTVLHEIAHALCGKRENHSARWLATARSIGYIGSTRHTGPTPDHLARWIGTCAAGHSIVRYRRPRNMVASCSQCHPRFNTAFVITWTELG